MYIYIVPYTVERRYVRDSLDEFEEPWFPQLIKTIYLRNVYVYLDSIIC